MNNQAPPSLSKPTSKSTLTLNVMNIENQRILPTLQQLREANWVPHLFDAIETNNIPKLLSLLPRLGHVNEILPINNNRITKRCAAFTTFELC